MVCPTAANMEKCDPKCRCTSGPCANIAYDCANPCPDNSEFDPATCECSDSDCFPSGDYEVSWTFTYDYTARENCSTNPICNINCDNERIECGTETTVSDEIDATFSYAGGGCLVPRYLTPAFDACGTQILLSTVEFYSCPSSTDDPHAAGSPCALLYSLSRRGCSPGVTGGSLTYDVIEIEP